MSSNGQIFEIPSNQYKNYKSNIISFENNSNEQYNNINADLSIPDNTYNNHNKNIFIGDNYNIDNYNINSAEVENKSHSENIFTNYNYINDTNNNNNITAIEYTIPEQPTKITNNFYGIPYHDNIGYGGPNYEYSGKNQNSYPDKNYKILNNHEQVQKNEIKQINPIINQTVNIDNYNLPFNVEEKNFNNHNANKNILANFDNNKSILQDIIKINRELNNMALNENEIINNINENNSFQNNNYNSIFDYQINNNSLNDSLISDSSSSENNNNNNNNINGDEMNQNYNVNRHLTSQNNNNNIYENHQINDDNFTNSIINNNFFQNNNSIGNNTPNSKKEKFSFSRYTRAIRTGLVNLGDTSYLNAALQLLGNIRNFASFFLKPKNIKYIKDHVEKMPLSNAIQELYLHLYPYPEKEKPEIYNPKLILNVLSKLNLVYQSKKRRNPNNLISFILKTLHNEINSLKDNKEKKIPNVYDKKNAIKCAISNFKKANNSIISNHLNWFELKKSKCNQCNKKMYNLSTFNIFELDLLESYKSKKSKIISIYDCLQYYNSQKPQKFFCNNCQKYTNSKINTIIFCTSNIFIFSLDRNNLENNYIKIPFMIDEHINLIDYVENNNKDIPLKFQLIGIISFYKSQDKYVSFCKSPVDNHWYVFNDEKIEETQINLIINLHNNNNLYLEYIPFILAYQKI